MTDRELLELAAIACGKRINKKAQAERDALIDPTTASLWLTDGTTAWNPLKHQSDAFGALCQKSMRIVESNGGAYRAVQFTLHPETDQEEDHEVEIEWPHSTSAHCLAITRAAAEIGKAMKEKTNG